MRKKHPQNNSQSNNHHLLYAIPLRTQLEVGFLNLPPNKISKSGNTSLVSDRLIEFSFVGLQGFLFLISQFDDVDYRDGLVESLYLCKVSLFGSQTDRSQSVLQPI